MEYAAIHQQMNEEQEKIYLLAKERLRELRQKWLMADCHSARHQIGLQMGRLETFIECFEATV